MIKPVEIRTISEDLSKVEQPTKIRLFNFSEGVLKIDLTSTKKRQKIGAFGTTWIRVYDINNTYYDYITSSLFFMINEAGASLLCAEDTEFINAQYIGDLIRKYVGKSEKKSSSANQFIDIYNDQIKREIERANKNLMGLYSISNQTSSDRLDVEDTYEHGKAKIARRYLLDMIAKRLIKENREEIVSNLI